MTVGTESNEHLAVRPGVVYTSTGVARFGLPVGEYTITLTLDGFKVVTRSGIILQVGQRLSLPITLPIGSRADPGLMR